MVAANTIAVSHGSRCHAADTAPSTRPGVILGSLTAPPDMTAINTCIPATTTPAAHRAGPQVVSPTSAASSASIDSNSGSGADTANGNRPNTSNATWP